MKRSFLIALSAATLSSAMVGCVKNDLLNAPDPQELGFDTHVDGATKGVSKTEFKMGDQFAIMATQSPASWTTADNNWFMGTGGVPVSVTMTKNEDKGDGAAWKYAPVKLWPEKDMLSFFAFSPAVANGIGAVTATNGSPKVEFAVSDNIKGQIDLLCAEALDKSKATGTVALSFRHALTRITFAAKANITATQMVRLDKVELKGINSQSTLTLYDENRVIGDPTDLGGWAAATTPKSYSPALSHEVVGAIPKELTNMISDDQALYMIPQQLDANDAILEVTYSYSNNSGKQWINNSKLEIKLADKTPYWNPSKNYRYVLTLSPDKVYEFGAVIEPWDADIEVVVKDAVSTKAMILDPTGAIKAEFTVSETRGDVKGYRLVSSDDTWLKISDVADGSAPSGAITYNEDGTVTKAYDMEKKWYVVTDVNTTGANRVGIISLKRDGQPDSELEITQQGANPFVNCVLAEQVPAEAIYKVEGMIIPFAAGFTSALKADAAWFKLSLDGVAANATTEIQVAGNADNNPVAFYVHYAANKNIAARQSKIIFNYTNVDAATTQEIAAFQIKQKAVPQPFAAAAANPTIHYSDGKTQITKMATAIGVEYTVSVSGTGAAISLDGNGNGTASVKFTAVGTESSLYLHYTENPSTSSSRNFVLSVDVTGATTKTFTQPLRVGLRVGKFAGTLKTETVGTETHYYYNATLYIAPENQGIGLKWSNATGTTGVTDKFNGKANSAKLTGAAYPAANVCNTKSPAGYYLPALNQLAAVWITKPGLGSSITTENHWTSTEDDSTYDWCIPLNNGLPISLHKTNTNYCVTRCVRDVTN